MGALLCPGAPVPFCHNPQLWGVTSLVSRDGAGGGVTVGWNPPAGTGWGGENTSASSPWPLPAPRGSFTSELYGVPVLLDEVKGVAEVGDEATRDFRASSRLVGQHPHGDAVAVHDRTGVALLGGQRGCP